MQALVHGTCCSDLASLRALNCCCNTTASAATNNQPRLCRAGLLRVVRTRCATHSDTDERKLAQALLRKWQPPEPAEASNGGRPGSAQASQAASRAPSRPPSRAGQQLPGAASQQKGSQADLASYLDEETARRLEEIQQRKKEAEAEAERLRQEEEAAAAAAVQQPGPSSAAAAESRISSFEVR